MQIVHQISLHPVNYLEKALLVRLRLTRILTAVLLRLPQILPHMVRVGKRLHHPVIGDGNGRMSPLIGTFYKILRLGNPVHITHLRMTVKLHPLSDASVLPGSRKVRNLFYASKRADCQLVIKLVNRRHTLKFDKDPLFHNIRYFFDLLVPHKEFHRHGVRVIRDIINQNGPLILDLPLVHTDDPAADDHLTDLPDDILDGHGLLLKVPAVDHIWIVGPFQRTFKVALLPVPAACGFF